MKILSVLAVVMGGALFASGLQDLVRQWRLLHHASTVEAVIETAEVESHYSGHVLEYAPAITYRYRVGEAWHESQDVFPGSQYGQHAWAEEIVNRYPPGTHTTALYDPQHPDQAFLVPSVSFTPHICVLLGFVFLGMAPSFYLTHRNKEARAPLTPAGQWFALRPAWNWRLFAPLLLVFGVIVLAGSIVAIVDFYRFAIPPYGWLDIAYTIGMPGAGLAAIGVGLYVLVGMRGLGEPSIRFDRPQVQPGEQITLRFEQTIWKTAVVRKIEIQLTCRRDKFIFGGMHGHIEETDVYAQTIELANAREVTAGTVLTEEFHVAIPFDCPPSTPLRWWAGPRHYWRINVKTHLRGQWAYEQQFFFRVEASSRELDEARHRTSVR